MSQYVDQGILKEFHADANSTSYAERVSFGSTTAFVIRASATISSVGATGLSTASEDFTAPPWARGLEVYAAVTAVTSATSGDSTLTYKVQPKTPDGAAYLAGSSWFGGYVAGSTTLFSGATGDSYLSLFPGNTVVAGGAVAAYSAPVPQVFRVATTLAGSSASWTYAVKGRYIP